MLLGKIFEQFAEESPISVMMRGIVEYAFDAKRLDEIFEETADAQYTRELRFSTVADLMSEVVFNISPSVGAAYQANVGHMTVSRKSVYNKLNGIESQISVALVEDRNSICARHRKTSGDTPAVAARIPCKDSRWQPLFGDGTPYRRVEERRRCSVAGQSAGRLGSTIEVGNARHPLRRWPCAGTITV